MGTRASSSLAQAAARACLVRGGAVMTIEVARTLVEGVCGCLLPRSGGV